MTPAHAPPSSAQGVTPVLLVVRGFAAQPSLPPRARGAEIPLIIWLCPYGQTRMIRRRRAWIDVFVPLPPEIRQLGLHVSGGGLDCSRAPYPLFSLSLPMSIPPSFFSPLAVFLLCVGASLPSFRLVVADPRGGAHHRKCGLSTHTAVGEISWSVGLSWKTYSHRSSIVHCGRYLRSYHGLGIPRFCTDI